MKKDEFLIWYKENIDLMVEMGVLHPDSPFGKTVRLAVSSMQPEIERINERLDTLEDIIHSLDTTKSEVQKIKKVVKETKKEVRQITKVDKPVEEKKNEAPKSSWLITKR